MDQFSNIKCNDCTFIHTNGYNNFDFCPSCGSYKLEKAEGCEMTNGLAEFKKEVMPKLKALKESGVEVVLNLNVKLGCFEIAWATGTIGIELEDEKFIAEVKAMFSEEKKYTNCNGEKVSAIHFADLYNENNCTHKNKRVDALLKQNPLVHQWNDHFMHVIGTKRSIIYVSKKKTGNIMCVWR